MDYLNYIIKSRILKRSDIQINIPTFNSYEITKNTIQKLYNQKNIRFDILLIDNGSDDYEKLIQDFPDINYVLLKENTGSNGAQRIGAELALKNKYEYIIFTDNDAILLDNYGLAKMKENFINRKVVAVVPQNIDLLNIQKKGGKIKELKGFFPLHYFFVRTNVFKKTGLHNFYLFLSGDDVSISSKLLSYGEVILDSNVLFYHPIFKPKNIQNRNIFLTIRSLIIIIFFEKGIKFKWKFRTFLYTSFIFFQAIIHTIKFLDISYIKTLFLILSSFIHGYRDMDKLKELLKKIPENKYVLKEINQNDLKEDEASNFINISNLWRLLFIPEKCFIHSNYLKRNIYFILTKNKLG